MTKTQDTEAHDYGTESPVHMMSDKQLRREKITGYLICLTAVLFISFLVFGYMLTMEKPLCICENDDFEQTGECKFTNLTEPEQLVCDGKLFLR